MPRKSVDKADNETKHLRVSMKNFMDSDKLTESQALERVLPLDTHRAERLKLWKKSGLWPLQEPTTTANDSGINYNNLADVTDDIMEMVEWWRARRGVEETKRPWQFVGVRTTTSIKISDTLMKAGLKKARKESFTQTRGSLSGLIDYLLFLYCDSDPDFIEE